MLEKNYMEQKEMVNHPKHYCKGKHECIDVMIDIFGIEEVKIWCKITAFKYNWRIGKKDDEIQEASKGIWYLNKFIELSKKQRETITPNKPYQSTITQEEFNNIIRNNE